MYAYAYSLIFILKGFGIEYCYAFLFKIYIWRRIQA